MDSEPINPTKETSQTSVTPAIIEPTGKPAKKPTSSGFAIASFILTMIPILLISYVIAASEGGSDNGKGAIFWLVIFYYWSVGVPIFILSIVFAIIGLRSKQRALAIASLVIKFTAPVSIFILDLLFMLFMGQL